MEKRERVDKEKQVKIKTERRNKTWRTVGKREISKQRRRKKKEGTRGRAECKKGKSMSERMEEHAGKGKQLKEGREEIK